MKRTISIRLEVEKVQIKQLSPLQENFHSVCNAIVPYVMEHRCWNRVALHNLVYSEIRSKYALGSQMVCNAIFAVCKAYKSKHILKKEEVPKIHFKNRSVHFDKKNVFY